MPVVSAKEYLRAYKEKIGLRSQSTPLGSESEEITALLEFAEMHRKEALEQASKKARTQFIPDHGRGFHIVNKDSILNAYSKKNIK